MWPKMRPSGEKRQSGVRLAANHDRTPVPRTAPDVPKPVAGGDWGVSVPVRPPIPCQSMIEEVWREVSQSALLDNLVHPLDPRPHGCPGCPGSQNPPSLRPEEWERGDVTVGELVGMRKRGKTDVGSLGESWSPAKVNKDDGRYPLPFFRTVAFPVDQILDTVSSAVQSNWRHHRPCGHGAPMDFLERV